ncbi:IclR family transcriptional regulator [Micromonospora sp. NBC_01796]|uniref:IclR family transcriptional regulator n=1 Tax=Micromonospora sp. NBC_01796 TaxID=2975987 RepID=UPI002DD8941A|nr:IclR family transcriptional regulator [Micromonospora sp. NBC_01796]WSA85772.1 IclR family transcriptional regulator [Micromonospora sp. NBC_01796]
MAEATARSGTAERPAEGPLVGSDRVLAVLAELARHPDGIALDDLARTVASPKPTVHRALAALRRAGFATQDDRRQYVLGDEFIRLAFANHEARLDHLRVVPILRELSARHGETAHYAVLDGRSVVYRSKIDPPSGAVRLTSTVGGRNPAHSTALGKLLLAHHLPDDNAVRAWAGSTHLEPRTERTRTAVADLCAELALTRQRGYGVEDQENEPGVSCLALPLFLSSPTEPSGAVSISALTYRTPLRDLVEDLPAIRAIVERGGRTG